MACIVLKSELGERRIPEGKPYKLLPDESVAGVDYDCSGITITTQQQDVEKVLEREGLKLGDAIAWVTKKVGLKQCAPCRARREILNNVSSLGWKETIRQIKETL